MTTHETYDQILGRLLTESAKKHLRWIVAGMIGFSIFCICLGILGVAAVVKSIFL